MRKGPPHKVAERLVPQWKRDFFRWLGIVVSLLAIPAYLRGLERVQSGDYQVLVQAASRSEYTEHISNPWLNGSFVLLIGGLLILAYSFRLKTENTSGDADKTPS